LTGMEKQVPLRLESPIAENPCAFGKYWHIAPFAALP
jgi:hypothetical protein